MPPRTPPHEPFNDDQIIAIVEAEVHSAIGGELYTALSQKRIKEMNYFYSRPFGYEVPDRSQVVTTDVSDVVESIMPSLARIFLGTNKAGEFTPTGPEDEDGADQATDYVAHLMFGDGDGYNEIYAWLKESLMHGAAVLEHDWETSAARALGTINRSQARQAETNNNPATKICAELRMMFSL